MLGDPVFVRSLAETGGDCQLPPAPWPALAVCTGWTVVQRESKTYLRNHGLETGRTRAVRQVLAVSVKLQEEASGRLACEVLEGLLEEVAVRPNGDRLGGMWGPSAPWPQGRWFGFGPAAGLVKQRDW